MDRYSRCTFVSRRVDLGVFERKLGVKGKKDYITGIGFTTRTILSLLQMKGYVEELWRLGIRLEDIFRWFFEDYLKNEFGVRGFTYTSPSEGTTYAEKCKLLAIVIDGVLKQYRLFCEDGFVDRELLELSSGHVVFSELGSLIQNKYAYANSEDIKREMFLLFSDQSMMHYTEKTKSKYRTLPRLLLSEKIKKEDFAHYQQRDLEWLISRGAVVVSKDNYLQVNRIRVEVLKDLFENEVVCTTHYGEKFRHEVETFVTEGDMCYGNTLFSRPEQDYLNYVLNKSEFSNGLDLRNKYAHDTCSSDEKIQSKDYLELQKIMVLITIKINEEVCIRNPL